MPRRSPRPAARDPSLETVIVTGERITPDAIAHDAIRAMVAPSSLLNEIARWRIGICPRTDGLSTRNLNNYVIRRIRDIAKQAGAPLADEPCKSNVEVLFTDQPQHLLDTIRQKNSIVLGYHPATVFSHAVQAWYETGTTDINGQTVVDDDVMGTIQYTNGGGYTVNGQGQTVITGRVIAYGLPTSRIQGWKGRPEVTSDILGVFIIADSRQTGNLELGPVADYVAMLALSRLKDDQSCQPVSSIVNLMAPSCADKPLAITASDIGFLRGVYKMDPGATLLVQENDIAAEMAKAIPAKTGP